jgi:hypothetical protein
MNEEIFLGKSPELPDVAFARALREIIDKQAAQLNELRLIKATICQTHYPSPTTTDQACPYCRLGDLAEQLRTKDDEIVAYQDEKNRWIVKWNGLYNTLRDIIALDGNCCASLGTAVDYAKQALKG